MKHYVLVTIPARNAARSHAAAQRRLNDLAAQGYRAALVVCEGVVLMERDDTREKYRLAPAFSPEALDLMLASHDEDE